jgi:hypothetical protein
VRQLPLAYWATRAVRCAERAGKAAPPEVLVQQVATVLEHIERHAGGDVRNAVIPPMPRVIDRQLMLRRQNGERAVAEARAACQFNNTPPPAATPVKETSAGKGRVGSAGPTPRKEKR